MAKQAINRLYDFEIVQTLIYDVLRNRDIETSLGIDHAIIQTSSSFHITISRENFESSINTNNEALDVFKNSKSYTIEKIVLRSTDARLSITYERSNGRFTDYLSLDNSPNYNPTPITIQDIKAFTTISELLLRNTANHQRPSDPEQAKSHYEVLAQLQKLTSDIAQSQVDYRSRVDQEKENYLLLTQNELKTRLEELSSKYQKRTEDLERKYETANEALAAREKAVIDADNTTSRRKTTEDVLLNTKIKAESFNFSRSVSSGRRIVLILSYLLLVFGVFNAVHGAYSLSELQHTSSLSDVVQYKPASQSSSEYDLQPYRIWLAIAKIISGAFLCVSTVVYLIRWQNQWTNKIANIELEYQKFSRDLNRAHVTIEMCLEWNDKKDGAVPETLLAAMTDGLFKEGTARPEEVLHPAEQLAAAMLKTADRIEFPLGNGSITTSGKKLSQSAKEST